MNISGPRSLSLSPTDMQPVNSLLGRLPCASQKFTISPALYPQTPAVTIGNVPRHPKCTLENRITHA